MIMELCDHDLGWIIRNKMKQIRSFGSKIKVCFWISIWSPMSKIKAISYQIICFMEKLNIKIH